MPTASSPRTPALFARCMAELIGTFILVFFGCGVVHAAVLTGAQSGLWQVAIVWGVGDHARHLCRRRHQRRPHQPGHDRRPGRLGPLPPGATSCLTSLARWRGGSCAAVALYGLFAGHIERREQDRGVIRGEPGSELTAMCYGEYFPNPGAVGAGMEEGTGRSAAEFVAIVPITTAPRRRGPGHADPGHRRVRRDRSRNAGGPPARTGAGVHRPDGGGADLGDRPADAGVLQPGPRLRPAPVRLLRRLGRDRHPRARRRLPS